MPAADRWPDRLVRALGPTEPMLLLVANLAVNGYTSADLIRVELPRVAAFDPDFVTLLIGVNDVVRGVPLERYAANVETILETLLARLPADRIVTVATPDYTVTPAGADFGDPRRQHDGIVAVNATLARLAGDRGIGFVDIFDVSLEAADRSDAGRRRWASPERSPVRPLGRTDPAGRRGPYRTVERMTPRSPEPGAQGAPCSSSWSRSSEIPKWWAIS